MAESGKNNLSITSSTRGLATVALLKARLDEGLDQIETFMPLVLDAIASLNSNNFTVSLLQQEILSKHGLAIPLHTLATLLSRAVKRRVIIRDSGSYRRLPGIEARRNLEAQKEEIIVQQTALREEFVQFANERGLTIVSSSSALDLILGFLEDHKVAMLLNGSEFNPAGLSSKESKTVAEFIRHIILNKPDLALVLKEILEGLVVYNTAFLADITSPSRKINGLQVFFDTRYLFELLGYDGDALTHLARETHQLLRNAGVQCLHFDKTLHEMEAVLRHIENNIGTTEGIKRITVNSTMARQFVQKRYSPSDIREISSLLQHDLATLDVQMVTMPKHVPKYTLDEKKLVELFHDRQRRGGDDDRVNHDVDCISGILTLRAGNRSSSLADTKAVFATSTYKVILNTKRWYEDERQTGIPPAVHIRALANLAWLRKPALAVNLKLYELVVLCQSALRPSKSIWSQFIDHLNKLEKNKKLNSDESVAIVVSKLTEDLLMDVDDDPVEAGTLDDVIERVRETYRSEGKKAALETARHYEDKLSLARGDVDSARRQSLRLEGRAISISVWISKILVFSLSILAIIGAVILIISHPFENTAIGWVAGVFIIVFVLLELLGVLSHLASIRQSLQNRLFTQTRRFFALDEPIGLNSPSTLGLVDITRSKEPEPKIIEPE